jgi:predicted nucleic acid-binding protein
MNGAIVTYLVDTTILTDPIRGRPEATAWLQTVQSSGLAISAIT